MVNRIKASLELSLLIFALSLFLVVLGIYGISEIKVINKNSEELFEDRMLPMDQLGDIRFYTASVLSVSHQAMNKQISFHDAKSMIQKAQDSINANWELYNLTYFTPQEKLLAAQTAVQIKKFNLTLEKVKSVLQKEDVLAFEEIIKNDLNRDFNTIFENVSGLLRLQVKIANDIHSDNKNRYKIHIWIIAGILMIILSFTVPFSLNLLKKYRRIINGYNLSNVKLSLSEDNYRSLIEYAGEAIFILDESVGIIDLNNYACKLTGYSREELLEMNISDFVSEVELNKQAEDIARIKRDKFAVLQRTIIRKDGSLLETEISNRLIEGKGFFAIVRDVTERKKSEEAMRLSEEQYRYLFDNSPAYIIIWDLKTLDVLKVNDAVFNKYGYSEEEWATMKVLDFRPEEDREGIKEFAQMMLVNNDPIVKRTWKHIKKSGEVMLMNISSHRIQYEGHEAILSLAEDVTEQVKAENALAEREAQLKLFIEHSPASLAMFDNEMRYLITSRRWISDYNLGDMDIIGMSHYDVFPEMTQEWKDIHKRSLAGEVIKREDDCFVRSNGSVEWLRGEIRPWFKASGEIGGIIIFAEVITERKRATEMFKNQFENSPDIILYVNRYYRIEAINRIENPDLTEKDVIGADCIAILPEISQKTALDALVKCFETGEKQEFENVLSHGRWVKSRIVPITTNGEVTHVMIFATDITERKNFEEELIKYNAELKKTNAELDRFVYSTSHDLRAPLKSMLGLINITKDTLITKEDLDVTNVVMERLDMLEKSAVKLDSFIEDILIFSRNARTELELEEIDLETLIHNVKMNLKFVDSADKIDFKLTIDSKAEFVSDYKRINVVLNNVLSNAYKYYDETKEKPFIHIAVACDDEKAVFVIEDNGIGIAAADQEKIFDMFYRSTTRSTGSGLGLYIAKETLEKIEGTIKVESELNLGTKFIIEIPNKPQS